MCQLAGDGVTDGALAATPSAPVIGFDDPARKHGGVEVLASDDESEFVEAADLGQGRRR